MRNRRRRWFFRRAALAFAVAAVAAPTAQARIIDDPGVHQGGTAAIPDESKIRPSTTVHSAGTVVWPTADALRQYYGRSTEGQVWPTADALRPYFGPSTTALAGRPLPDESLIRPTEVVSIPDESLVRHGRIQAPVTTPVVTSSDGFDWGDAGIGAAVVLVVGLCGGLMAFALVGGRRETLAGA